MDHSILYDIWHQAYTAICLRRIHAPVNNDIWHLRFHCQQYSMALFHQVMAGRYVLSPVSRSRGQGPLQWSVMDAVVLEFLMLCLKEILPVHDRRQYQAGGLVGAVAQVSQRLASGRFSFVYRTNIRGFYEHIRKPALISLGEQHIHDQRLRTLYEQYVCYAIEDDGVIHSPLKGICHGGALSPLISASVLYHIDNHFEQRCGAGFWFARYMDDFLILSEKRWPVKHAISWLQTQFDLEGVRSVSDKTVVGRVDNGFDWLGVRFDSHGKRIAPEAIASYQRKRAEKYQHCQCRRYTRQQTSEVMEQYDRRWARWAALLLTN